MYIIHCIRRIRFFFTSPFWPLGHRIIIKAARVREANGRPELTGCAPRFLREKSPKVVAKWAQLLGILPWFAASLKYSKGIFLESKKKI